MEKHQVENLCIIGVGAIMHLSKLSVISNLNDKATVLVPNAASLLVAVSLLSLLTQWRPNWISPVASTRSQQIFLQLLELMIIMGLVELMLLQIWIPMLIGLDIVCGYIAHDLLMANNQYLANNTPHFAYWLRCQAFYQARFLLALAVASGIVLSQGWQSVIQKCLHEPATRAGATTAEPAIEERRVNQLTRGARYMLLDGGQELEEECNC